MTLIITAVRQIASGLRRAEERFCLVYELRLIDTNGFAFVPSEELAETDVIDRLIDVGYTLRNASRLIAGARALFARHSPTSLS